MNLIANTGIQYYTTNLEVNLNDNFKMHFHEWFDTQDTQLKLEVAHCFSEEEIWVKKHDLALLGYVNNGKVSESWENIKEDFFLDHKQPIKIETESPADSGCFQESINKIK